jgi:hypothetical protein
MLTPNLRRKKALVVDAAGTGRLEETPADPPTLSTQLTDVDGELDAAGTLTAHVRLELRGDVELLLRALTRATPRAQWKKLVEGLNQQAGLGGEISDWTISDPSDTRKPLVMDYRVAATAFVDRSKKSVQVDLPLSDTTLPEVEKTDTDPQPPVDLGSSARVPLPLSRDARPGVHAAHASAGIGDPGLRRVHVRVFRRGSRVFGVPDVAGAPVGGAGIAGRRLFSVSPRRSGGRETGALARGANR